jgi:ATP-dependent protease ClpP protease subunit
VAKINIKGAIIPNDDKWVYDWYEMDSTCPKDVQTVIDSANGEKIEVEISSGGGDIFAGADIYAALKRYNGEVEITIPSLAGSAASEIAMAGKCSMMPSALMMVHNVSVYGASGDYHDMEKMSEMLKKANQSIANTYMTKSGMSNEEVLEMMDKTTWLTAQEAKEKGLIDEVLFMDDKNNTSFQNAFSGMLTKEKIEFAKNAIQKQELETKENENLKDKLLIELDLL